MRNELNESVCVCVRHMVWEYVYTQVIDYLFMFLTITVNWNYIIVMFSKTPDVYGIALGSILFTITYYFRERLYFYLLGDSVPKIKRE